MSVVLLATDTALSTSVIFWVIQMKYFLTLKVYLSVEIWLSEGRTFFLKEVGDCIAQLFHSYTEKIDLIYKFKKTPCYTFIILNNVFFISKCYSSYFWLSNYWMFPFLRRKERITQWTVSFFPRRFLCSFKMSLLCDCTHFCFFCHFFVTFWN